MSSHITLASLGNQTLRSLHDNELESLASLAKDYGESLGVGVAKNMIAYVLGVTPGSSGILATRFRDSGTSPVEVRLNGRSITVQQTTRTERIQDTPKYAISILASETLAKAKAGEDYSNLMATLLFYCQLVFDADHEMTLGDIAAMATVDGQKVLDFTFSPYSVSVPSLETAISEAEAEEQKTGKALEAARKSAFGKATSADKQRAFVGAQNAYDEACKGHKHAQSNLSTHGSRKAIEWMNFAGIATQVGQVSRVVA